ncbi:MAG: RDD family protein [Erysipelotrichales bacterium]|nr:RDD family protein [Erysipelotrichales bacterium]
MKKTIFRVLAFVLDIAFASLIIFGITSLSFINPNKNELNKKYNTYYYNVKVNESLVKKTEEFFEDKILTSEELDEVNIFYKTYYDCFKDIKLDTKLNDEQIEKINEDISKKQVNITNNLVISINKLNTRETLISFVVYIMYFGLLQYILKGQTPFKMLFKLKVISNENKSVGLLSYLIRAILVTEVIISATDLIMLFALSNASYINLSYWLSQVKYIYEMAFLVCLIIRDDGRSIDDLILKTRVIRYDKQGHEVIDPLFIERKEDNA